MGFMLVLFFLFSFFELGSLNVGCMLLESEMGLRVGETNFL